MDKLLTDRCQCMTTKNIQCKKKRFGKLKYCTIHKNCSTKMSHKKDTKKSNKTKKSNTKDEEYEKLYKLLKMHGDVWAEVSGRNQDIYKANYKTIEHIRKVLDWYEQKDTMLDLKERIEDLYNYSEKSRQSVKPFVKKYYLTYLNSL